MMKFTEEYLESNYAEFFEYTNLRAADTHLPLIMNKAWRNKAALRDVFPFDNTGKLRISEYTDAANAALKSFEKTVDCMAVALEHILDGTVPKKHLPRMILANSVEYGHYKGRKISRLLSNADVRIPHHTREYIIDSDLCTELPRLPIHGKGKLDLIAQNFYSELAQLNKTSSTLYFTVNPVDMMRASIGKVLSCNKLGGLAESFPLSAATSTSMGLLRLMAADGTLLGRCWIGVSSTFLAYTAQPCYGMMGSSHVQDFFTWVRHWIDSRIPAKNTTDMWLITEASIQIPADIFAESAVANSYTDYSDIFMHRGTIEKAKPSLVPGFCCCAICGTPTPQLFCDECVKKYFTNCDKCRIKVAITKGTELCSSCASLQTNCVFCGKTFTKESHKSPNICRECVRVTTNCLFCGQTIGINSMNLSSEYARNNLYDITPLVPGSVYAHTSCLRTYTLAHCACCGEELPSYKSGVCLGCYIFNTVESATAIFVTRIKNFYKEIAGSSKRVPVDTTSDILEKFKNKEV